MATGDEWIGEIVRWRGQLWTVESTAHWGAGGTWLNLTDHYGSGDEAQVRAADVEIGLQ